MAVRIINIRATDPRPSRAAMSIHTQGDAAAVGTALELLTVGQITSIYERKFFDNALPYPEGTRKTANMLMEDATHAVYRLRVLNAVDDITEEDLADLLMGVVGDDGISSGFTALSGPPGIPATLAAISTVISTPTVTKS